MNFIESILDIKQENSNCNDFLVFTKEGLFVFLFLKGVAIVVEVRDRSIHLFSTVRKKIKFLRQILTNKFEINML